VSPNDDEFVAELRKCWHGTRKALVRVPESDEAMRRWLRSLAGAYQIAIKQVEQALCREKIERQLRKVECGFQVLRVTARLRGYGVPLREGMSEPCTPTRMDYP
jgi:hypothetical protein